MGLKRETPAWHKKLTGRFDNDTRMVGPIISCEGTPYQGDPDREWRVVPHVQSHAIAVDQVRSPISSLCMLLLKISRVLCITMCLRKKVSSAQLLKGLVGMLLLCLV